MAKPRFNNHPFPYHAELELEITTLTNLGVGLGRVALPNAEGAMQNAESPGASSRETDQALLNPQSALPNPPSPTPGWVVMVPFALAGERVRARVFRNHKNYSEADLVTVLRPSPQRIAPRCPLFGQCGGCQYQNLDYAAQLQWKQRHVQELLHHLARLDVAVQPVIPSPREFGYRSKITPHFNCGPREAGAAPGGQPPPAFPIGFLRAGSRFALVDVPQCPIATDAINQRLPALRDEIRTRAAAGGYQRGATVLLRDSRAGVTSDYDATVTEEIALAPGEPGDAKSLRLQFLARDFFQNNPFILPVFARYVREQAAAAGARFLVDAYCGSGLFALAAAGAFAQVAGIEISETSVQWARANAVANGIGQAQFRVGDAAAIFAGLDFEPDRTAVVIDPPRRGCDESFLRQLIAFGPQTVVYVSCDPATQMRDLATLVPAGYAVTAVQPFDLFPQTRHLECVITLRHGPVAASAVATGGAGP